MAQPLCVLVRTSRPRHECCLTCYSGSGANLTPSPLFCWKRGDCQAGDEVPEDL